MINKKIETKIASRISRMKNPVILREDFADLGGYDQVGRALRRLVVRGKIAKVGYGLYAKTKVSPISGQTILTESFPSIAEKALKRLKVKTRPSRVQEAYASGKSTQVPTGRVIAVEGRISRKISYKGNRIYLERCTK